MQCQIPKSDIKGNVRRNEWRISKLTSLGLKGLIKEENISCDKNLYQIFTPSQIPPLPTHYSSDLCSIVQSMLELEPEKRPSAARLLRHSYIKKQIALFLEGTKNR